MLAFQKIQKQRQIKRNLDLSPKHNQTGTIILEGSHFNYKNRLSFNEENNSRAQYEYQHLTLHQSQDQIQERKSGNRVHHFEEMKAQNVNKLQPSSQKLYLDEEINELNSKREQKNTAWRDILDLSQNGKGSETSRMQNRITTPQQRVSRFHGFQQNSRSSDKQNFQKTNLSIHNNNYKSIGQPSLSPKDQDGSNLLHSQYHIHQNKDSLIYVRRIQTPNKFPKPHLFSPLKQEEKNQFAGFQNEIIQKTNFILQNKDFEKPTLPTINIDKKHRELRQKEIQEKMRSYFIKTQIKFQQENNNLKYNNCSIRGLSMTPIQKQRGSIINNF